MPAAPLIPQLWYLAIVEDSLCGHLIKHSPAVVELRCKQHLTLSLMVVLEMYTQKSRNKEPTNNTINKNFLTLAEPATTESKINYFMDMLWDNFSWDG